MRTRTTLASLDCTVFPEGAGAAPRAVVVMCHGFGAPGDDLVGLYGALVEAAPALGQCRWVFPAAPLELDGGGRAWWMIDFAQLQAIASGGADAMRAFREVEPEGLSAARKQLLKLVDELSLQTQLPYGRIVLCGFSQGAMLTTDVALRLPEAPLGLGILSGTLLTESAWAPRAKARAGLPIFQSHGRLDGVLQFSAATALHGLLTQAGCPVEFVPFTGGHTIPPEVVGRFAAYLAARVG
jgi:phospholipase/carboxylesterase